MKPFLFDNPYRKRIQSLFAVVTLLLFFVSTSHTYARETGAQSTPVRAIAATVQVLTLDRKNDIISSGSGTVIDPRGIILTNYHVIGSTRTGKLAHPQGLVAIAVTTNLRQPAQPMLLAQVLPDRSDPGLDLAVLRVIADIDGDDLTSCLQLNSMPIGDDNDLAPNDQLTLIGFPGVGGRSYTLTSGHISGFTSSSGVVTWIKTDATIGAGNSGGAAINSQGELIGVPTAVNNGESGDRIGLVRPISLANRLLTHLNTIEVPGCQPITLGGQVMSDRSRSGVAGALVIVLAPGITWQNFDPENPAHYLAIANTDRSGRFILDQPLDPDSSYRVGFFARSFQSVRLTNFTPERNSDHPSITEVSVRLKPGS